MHRNSDMIVGFSRVFHYWNITTLKSHCFFVSPHQIDAHEDDVNAVAFADASSQLLFSGSDDALCKVWDRRTLREDRPQPVGQLAGHRDGITFIHSKVGQESSFPNPHKWFRFDWWSVGNGHMSVITINLTYLLLQSDLIHSWLF